MVKLLIQSRQDAFTKIVSLKSKFDLPMNSLANESSQNNEKLLAEVQKTKHELANLLIKQKVFFQLRLNHVQSRMERRLGQVTDTSNLLKKREVSNRVANELKNILIVQQKMAIKKQLAKLDAEYNALKAELDKEVCCQVSSENTLI